ncbi:Thiamine-binding periplasmic protein [Aliiroseovarius sp. xm-m-379]|uniref:thiamine ABC transporter substrate binding subunit n=1 Tax=unclassified Aliiroseovarius TaxID=2623558 RepID=UPI0015687458|nr:MULTISPECIES: thiamine ABC transporter substrate binding subunit [unclassified Aliiroseovarius]NRP13198.1 Thiamine-binding periplasmic protein [Aliiroseovarius sp. xm-d-517]NRP23970.1 Thiamine-binding periplasmic protein [Aliiroseovarius sp. xm-m-379]NRP30220.1 Thiamine-binding periplasmic protein [Aliiroseovarius sp. xm-m-314]NRP32769.1 Thiamine-binding periplasmic protein [Aliiroseovarius sp. xm-a-104]NRP40327.1 Thiamine-binding periplasmic protein [Aliiroseovarius sp. xm-m-339-2]
MKRTSLVAGALLIAGAAHAETLTVYTYDSFTSDWGPGPAVEKAFEAECGCDLQFVAVGDGAELLSRLKLEGARTEADVVLGLDTNLTAAAKATGLFADHGVTADWTVPVEWTDTTFIPYDWGYFAFVYDKAKVTNPPKSFDELAASELKIVIQDPRSSTPGLGLLMWVKDVYGDKAPDAWAGLNDQIVTVTKGWSEAYGMFLEGEADMVLSYTTSPAYHLIAEEDDSKAAAAFDEGNYLQVEVAGKIAGTDQPELADKFLAFVASDAFQSIIPTTNWMYPAVTPAAGLPDGFDTLAKPAKSLLIPADKAEMVRDAALEEWLAVSAQ